MIIYRAVNEANGKVYIGQTIKRLKSRVSQHARGCHWAIQLAIQKYGIKAFTFTVIDTASTKEELDAKERMWIARYNSKAPNGYNLTDGGGGTLGYHLSESTRAKIGACARGRAMSEETKQKISTALANRFFSEAHREHLSHSLEKRMADPETRLEQSSRIKRTHSKTGGIWKGRRHTPETRAKMSAARKRYWSLPENAHRGSGRTKQERCNCGAMTLKTAVMRGHRC